MNLEKVIIPDSILFIGDFCFEGCISLKEIYLSEGSSLDFNIPKGCKVYYYSE